MRQMRTGAVEIKMGRRRNGMIDRKKVIGLLQETAEYFRECRSNASFASKAENHFWELQNAANEAVELLKEQEEEIENLKQTCQSMMEGVCLLKEHESVMPKVSSVEQRCGNCNKIIEMEYKELSTFKSIPDYRKNLIHLAVALLRAWRITKDAK